MEILTFSLDTQTGKKIRLMVAGVPRDLQQFPDLKVSGLQGGCRNSNNR